MPPSLYSSQSISCALRYSKPPRTILRKYYPSHLSLDTWKRKKKKKSYTKFIYRICLSLYQPSVSMEIINLNSWVEVAPAPIIYPQKKPSNLPELEPIVEEGAEEYGDDS